MHKISRSAVSPFTQEQWFALVNDIPSYSQFIPTCSNARVINEHDDGYTAEIELSLSRIRQTFATRNTEYPYEKVSMTLASGPFKSLQGAWTFEPVNDNQCLITFNLEYEFTSKTVGTVLGPMFRQLTDKTVQAFLNRANMVYGTKGLNSN